ncbi:MAG TPA: hypothetical protein PKI46_06200 [Bacteroidales bacterium]|nr:hypothetical protein [Bacteroidales bacterium]
MLCLFFDLSEKMSAYAVIEDNKIISYNSESMLCETFAETLFKLNQWIKDIVYKVNPDIIGIEDIFSQSVTGYKKLAKLQAIAELVCYNYNKQEPIFAIAKSIRKHFGLNIDKVLTEKAYNKKYKNKPKTPYSEYLKNENHYYNKFKHIDFNTKHLRIVNGELVDIRTKRTVLITKKGKIKTKGKLISEFDYAKKIVIVDYINRNYNTNFNYNDNDIVDAILGSLFLSKGFYKKAVKNGNSIGREKSNKSTN